jgi:hypothetical protein
VSAAEKIIGARAVSSGFGDNDLDAAARALTTIRRLLNQGLLAAADQPDAAHTKQIAALLVRSEHAQAAVLDAVLLRQAATVLTIREAIGQLRQAKCTLDLVALAASEAHYLGFDRILFSRIDHGLWLASSAYAGAD